LNHGWGQVGAGFLRRTGSSTGWRLKSIVLLIELLASGLSRANGDCGGESQKCEFVVSVHKKLLVMAVRIIPGRAAIAQDA
jgi:hypothetical protein